MFEQLYGPCPAGRGPGPGQARLLNHNYIGTEHLLLGLVAADDSIAGTALASMGTSLTAAQGKVGEIIGSGSDPPEGHIPFTPRAKKVMELSSRGALLLGHNCIGPEHLLLGLLREGDGVGAQVLTKLGADLGATGDRVMMLLMGPEEEHPEGFPWVQAAETLHRESAEPTAHDAGHRSSVWPDRSPSPCLLPGAGPDGCWRCSAASAGQPWACCRTTDRSRNRRPSRRAPPGRAEGEPRTVIGRG